MIAKRGPKTMWVLPAENAIQFKVTLKYIKPPIWRRLLLPENCTWGTCMTRFRSQWVGTTATCTLSVSATFSIPAGSHPKWKTWTRKTKKPRC